MAPCSNARARPPCANSTSPAVGDPSQLDRPPNSWYLTSIALRTWSKSPVLAMLHGGPIRIGCPRSSTTVFPRATLWPSMNQILTSPLALLVHRRGTRGVPAVAPDPAAGRAGHLAPGVHRYRGHPAGHRSASLGAGAPGAVRR